MGNRKTAIIEAVTDPRLFSLPLDTVGLFVKLAHLAEASHSAEIYIGLEIPSFDDLAKLLRGSEDQIIDSVFQLKSLGLLTISESGVITVRHMCAAVNRSKINRENGLKGGRPPKSRHEDG